MKGCDYVNLFTPKKIKLGKSPAISNKHQGIIAGKVKNYIQLLSTLHPFSVILSNSRQEGTVNESAPFPPRSSCRPNSHLLSNKTVQNFFGPLPGQLQG